MRFVVAISVLGSYLVWKLSTTSDQWVFPTEVGNPIGLEATDEGKIWLIAGEIFVFLFYWFKFNEWAGEGDAPSGFRPRPVQHFTTWLSYLGWNSLYGLIMISAFSVLVFFPEIVTRLIDIYVQTSKSAGLPTNEVLRQINSLVEQRPDPRIRDSLSTNDVAPFMVMLVTVVWSGIKPFSEFERRFRLRLQEHASVPTLAKDMIGIFATGSDTFSPEQDEIKKLQEKAEGRIGLSDFDTEKLSSDSPWAYYVRVEYLYHMLLQYKRAPVFSKLTERYNEEFQYLDKNIARLRERITKRITDIRTEAIEEKECDSTYPFPTIGQAEDLLQRLNSKNESHLRVQFFSAQYDDLKTDIDSAWKDILRLIVCSVLAVGKSSSHRHELFDAFGLRMKHRIPIQLSWQTLTTVVFGTITIVFICSAIYHYVSVALGESTAPIPNDLNEVFKWSVFACMMHMLAIIAGYSVQRSLTKKRKNLHIGKERLPARIDLFAEAIWGAAFGVALNVLFLAIALIPEGEFSKLENLWWWALTPGVTAFFAAVYTQQDNRYRLFGRGIEANKSVRDRQMLDTQALLTGLTAVFVAAALHFDHIYPINPNVNAFIAYVGITTTLIGLALAYILREWVEAENRQVYKYERRSNRRKHEETAKWWNKEKQIRVQMHSVSDNGAEVTTDNELKINSEGKLEIMPELPKPAKILRQDDADSNRYYIRFLHHAA